MHADMNPSKAHFSPPQIEATQKANHDAITLVNARLHQQYMLQIPLPSEYISETGFVTNEEEMKIGKFC